MRRVVVAMSGGVDSSVAIALLKEQGYEVIGITMRLFEEQDELPSTHPCCLSQDVGDAQQVCRRLNISHYVLNLAPQFKELVIKQTLNKYAQGKTPNPCLLCNQEIKFRLLLDKALALGADYLATGHYARIRYNQGRYQLLKAVDKRKDQSYFLYTLTQKELTHLLFPIGEYHKYEVREIARRLDLPVADKEESQDLCFAPNLKSFIEKNILQTKGEIINLNGEKVAEHPGIAFFTIGQRRGLRLSSSRPLYVVKINAVKNQLIVGPEEALYARRLIANEVSWVDELPSSPLKVKAKGRYQSPEVEAEVYPDKDRVLVIFPTPQRALTPGQSIVFYYEDEVLGGGVIEEVE